MRVRDLIGLLDKPENLDKEVVIRDVEDHSDMMAIEDVSDISSVVFIDVEL